MVSSGEYMETMRHNSFNNGRMEFLKKEISALKEENTKLLTKLTSLQTQQEVQNQENTKRFTEIYSYMQKLETAYYNGLRTPAQSQVLSRPNLDTVVAFTQENSAQKSMEELFMKQQR